MFFPPLPLHPLLNEFSPCENHWIDSPKDQADVDTQGRISTAPLSHQQMFTLSCKFNFSSWTSQDFTLVN